MVCVQRWFAAPRVFAAYTLHIYFVYPYRVCVSCFVLLRDVRNVETVEEPMSGGKTLNLLYKFMI